MGDVLKLAIGTFTRAPVPAPSSITRTTAGRAMALAPLVGMVLALVCGLPLLAVSTQLSALLLATITIALLAWGTRGLHLDGLADTADALGSGQPAQQALAIARKSDIGPFGVITLVLALLLQIGSLAMCSQQANGYLAFALAVLTSRVALTWACIRAWPAARPDGLGAVVAGTVPIIVPAAWTLIALTGSYLLAGLAGSAAAATGLIAAAVVLRIARRRLGGITGDVLGAVMEVTMTVSLVVLALAN